jgi:hypothetical protein
MVLYEDLSGFSYIIGCTNSRSTSYASNLGLMVVAVDSSNSLQYGYRMVDSTSSNNAYCRSVYVPSTNFIYAIAYYSDLGTMLLGRYDCNT